MYIYVINCILDSNDHILPKGTTCVISPIATHHRAELYPNPWAFNPEHFNLENVANRHKYSFIAFSGGPRGCIGKSLTIIVDVVLAAKISKIYFISLFTITKKKKKN